MNKSNVIELAGRVESTDPLTELLRSGARQLLQEAIVDDRPNDATRDRHNGATF